MLNQTSVRYGGVVFTNGDGIITSCTVTKTRRKKGGSCSLTIKDPRLELANALPLPARDSRVVVAVSWGPQGAQRLVFEGYAVTFEVNVKSKEISINAIDKSKVSRRRERARNTANVSLEALVNQLAEESGLTVDAAPAVLAQVRPFASVLQHGETDWQVLTRLCDAVGVDCWVEGSTLYLRGAGEVDAAAVARRYALGDRITDLNITVEEKTRRTTSNVVNLRGEPVLPDGDPDAVQRLVTLSRTGVLLASDDAPSYTDETVELALRAGARQRKVFTAQLDVSPGDPDAQLRRAVFVEGVGARYSGAWVVEEIQHDCTRDRTRFSIYNDGAP